jgi:hypothetical protein
LPGEVFILEFRRESDTYVLHVQDDDASSYNLGHDIQQVRRVFARLGLRKTGEDAIGMAREFGAATGSHKTGRVAAMLPRGAERQKRDVFARDDEERKYVALPALRSDL